MKTILFNLFLFCLFWCLSFIPQWVIGWFLSCWRKASPAFQNHMNESSWWCACDGERKCVVEMWLCEKEKRKEKRKMFCQKIFSPKRSFGKTEECFPRKGRGEEPSSPHGKDCQNGDDLFVFWGYLLFTWRERCLIKRERDSSSFMFVCNCVYCCEHTEWYSRCLSTDIPPNNLSQSFFEQKIFFFFQKKWNCCAMAHFTTNGHDFNRMNKTSNN